MMIVTGVLWNSAELPVDKPEPDLEIPPEHAHGLVPRLSLCVVDSLVPWFLWETHLGPVSLRAEPLEDRTTCVGKFSACAMWCPVNFFNWKLASCIPSFQRELGFVTVQHLLGRLGLTEFEMLENFDLLSGSHRLSTENSPAIINFERIFSHI